MRSEQKLLSLKAASLALRVRPENLKAEADAGRVPHVKVGDDYLFSIELLETELINRLGMREREAVHA